MESYVEGSKSFCTNEFQYLRLSDVGTDSSWELLTGEGDKRKMMTLLTRTLLFLYTSAILTINYASNSDIEQAYQLTHWGQFIAVVNFMFALLLTIYASTRGGNPEKGKAQPWLKFAYVLQSVSFNTQLLVCFNFWVFIAHTKASWDFFSIHLHLILFILTALASLMLRIPVRFVHFVYTSLIMITYTLFTYVLHVTGVKSAVYAVIDWQANPVRSLSLLLTLSTVGPIISNLVLMFISRLRCACRKKDTEKEVKNFEEFTNGSFSKDSASKESVFNDSVSNEQ